MTSAGLPHGAAAGPGGDLRGRVFGGDFRVVEPLGIGGMGTVYVAEQLSTGSLRALKTMHPRLVADARLRQRFEQEARVEARIDSDHVAHVVAAGVDADTGTPWLAMELLRGESLTARVERGPVSVDTVREVMAQLGHALGAAHAMGIVHRDLKPENIFLATPRREGVPFTLKVLDFGIAKVVADAPPVTTEPMGTPPWMAPEQTEPGREVTPATDVWALGLLAFYLLTGRLYWLAGDGANGTPTMFLRELLLDRLAPASMRAADYGCPVPIPPSFDAWFARCVDRSPERRYADGSCARAALDPILAAMAASSAPPHLEAVAGEGARTSPGLTTVSGWPPPPPLTLGAGQGVVDLPPRAGPPPHAGDERGEARQSGAPAPTAPRRWLRRGAMMVAVASISAALVTAIVGQRSVPAAPVNRAPSSSSAAPPSEATTAPSASSVAAPAPGAAQTAVSVDVEAAFLPSGEWLGAYRLEQEPRAELDFFEAAARCRAGGRALCSMVQWQRACESRPKLGAVETWTASLSGLDHATVAGRADGCHTRGRVVGVAESRSGALACCSRALTTRSGNRSEVFLRTTTAKLLALEAAVNGGSASDAARLLEDPLAVGQADPVPRDAAFAALLPAAHDADAWMRLERCAIDMQLADDTWSAECARVVQTRRTLTQTAVRYVWNGTAGRLAAVQELAGDPAASRP
ncbi:MAG: serine/threonine-protein kinase [Polyangiaceae bacterium]